MTPRRQDDSRFRSNPLKCALLLTEAKKLASELLAHYAKAAFFVALHFFSPTSVSSVTTMIATVQTDTASGY